jgi:hypothetical protein
MTWLRDAMGQVDACRGAGDDRHGLTQQAERWTMMHRQKQPAGKRKTVISSGATLVELTGVPADRLAAAEREAMLDQILTNLWKGKLTREAAIGRIMVKLGMNQRAAQDEVDGFLRD